MITFSFFFTFLLVMAAIQYAGARLFARDMCGFRPTLIIGVLSALIVVIPLGEFALARRLFSITAGFSIPLTAILFSKVLENASGFRLLDRKGLLSSWIFGLISGMVLYPMALGLGGFDPYEAGWSFSWLFVLLMTITIALLFMKNRFGIVLTACIAAYNLRLLESANLWDYIVDPLFVIISFAGLTHLLIKRVCNSGG